MKKIVTLTFITFICHTSWGQTNIFPSSGNVGIGTASPNAQLDIRSGYVLASDASNGSNAAFIQGNSTYAYFGSTSSTLKIALGNSTKYDFMVIDPVGGGVGIGTASPNAKLDIRSGYVLASDASNGSNAAFIQGNSTYAYFGSTSSTLKIALGNSTKYDFMVIDPAGGGVGIGTASPDAKLAVKGDIHAQEVRVDLNGTIAPDFVFGETYNLRSLAETEKYIRVNKHLPEIPSAAEMEEHGFELKEMNLKLLQKVEELTLYMIDMNKQMQNLKSANQELKEKVRRLENE